MVKVGGEDLMIRGEVEGRIEKGREEMKWGKCVRVKRSEDIDGYLESV